MSDNDADSKVEADTVGGRMLQYWNERKERLEHDFAIAVWALCIMPEVHTDVAARMTGHHREAIERVINKLYKNSEEDIDEVINDYWKQFKHSDLSTW